MPKAGQGLKTSRVRDEELDRISWVGNSLTDSAGLLLRLGCADPARQGRGGGESHRDLVDNRAQKA